MVACILFIRLPDSLLQLHSIQPRTTGKILQIPNGRCTAFGWTNTYKFLCVCVHVRQADYDYRLFIPSLFATKTHVARVRVFELVLIPCLQLISHDFIHVYSQEKLFNAFKFKQASDESTQTPPNTHRYVYVYIRTRMTTIKGRNIFPFFYSVFLSPIAPSL